MSACTCPKGRHRLPRFIDGRRIRSWRAVPVLVEVGDRAHRRVVVEVRRDAVRWERRNDEGVLVEIGACTRSRWKRWVRTGTELVPEWEWRQFFRPEW